MGKGPHNTDLNTSGSSAEAGREQQIAVAIADYLDRQTREEAIDPLAFCRAHPDLMPDLQEQIDTLVGIDRALYSASSLLANRPVNDTAANHFPERLSGHKVLGEIGSGGMGRVLLALDEKLNRKVAIKVLTRRYQDNPLVRDRFMQEARSLAALTHPNIVGIHNLGDITETPHFVMEYVQGVPLTDAAKPLSLSQKVELMRKVALAVEVLHQHGIIHRDLKPGNVLVGADLEPKVLDFGLALRVDDQERLTRPGEILGTRDYFSPEQARAEAPLDSRSDVFSLGAVLYQLLTSQLPFRGETFQEQVRSLCEEEPVLPRRLDPLIPGELQNICLKALEKNPANRYRSAREMAEDLARYLAGEPVLAIPTSYSRLTAGKIDLHLRELKGWVHDNILSDLEYDSFRKMYEGLIEREDAWIMAVRRLSFSQVSLYLGAWILVLGATLVALFHYSQFAGFPAVLVVSAATASTGYIGVRCWKQNQRRIGVAYLLAFCLLLPVAFAVAMGQYQVFTAASRGDEQLEFLARFAAFRRTTSP